jgi:hypothetical protein
VSTLKKTLVLVIAGEEIPLEVTMRVIEALERTFDANALTVAAVDLANTLRVKRSQVADAILEWLRVEKAKPTQTRAEMREAILGAPPEEFAALVGCLQAAALFTIRDPTKPNGRMIDDEQFAELANGKDLPEKKASPTSSTTSSTPAPTA